MSDSIISYLHQASEFLVEDGYDKHANPVLAIDQAAAELTRLRKLIEAKDEALENLIDESPWTDKWESAREKAKAALELK